MSDRVARAALTRLSEPGDVRLAALVEQLGAVAVYDLLRQEQDVTGVYSDVAARLRDLNPEQDLEKAAAVGIRLIVPGDDEWPSSLADLDRAEPLNGHGGAPIGVWARGPVRLDEACRPSVAVVGSRSATTYGQGVAREIAAHLAAEGICVVSGAAYGIDIAAHKGAIAGKGHTVAVLACGVDRAYPPGNKAALDHLGAHELVVSELAPGCAPNRLRFLVRNRLIAALSQGTVVVEAALRSGALNTANWAIRLNRQVMGVPGPVTSAPSQGVHELIRSQTALLVTSGADVVDAVSPVGVNTAPDRRGAEKPHDRLPIREQQVLEAVPVVQAAAVDSIARSAGLPVLEVSRTLGLLKAAGFVEQSVDRWRKVSARQL